MFYNLLLLMQIYNNQLFARFLHKRMTTPSADMGTDPPDIMV